MSTLTLPNGFITIERELRLRRELPPPQVCAALRKAARVSTRRLAAEVGVSHQAIVWWETGAKRPNVAHLEAYVRAIQVLQRELEAVRDAP